MKTFLLRTIPACCLLLASISGQTAPGDLDTSFNGTGFRLYNTGALESIKSLVLQPDGKILLGGSNGSDFVAIRLLADGTPDTSFGGTGFVSTPVGSGFDVGSAMVLQNDGKIVLVGYADDGVDKDFAIVRYLDTGALDTGFNGDGKEIFSYSSVYDEGRAVGLQSGGAIVAAGSARILGEITLFVTRYGTGGSIDTTFGTLGVTFLGGTEPSQGYALAVAEDDRILVGGNSGDPGDTRFLLARFEADGDPDATFSGGSVTTSIDGGQNEVRALAIQSDGKILAVGSAFDSPVLFTNFALARYLSDGSLDPAFGTGGTVVTDIGGKNDVALAVALQSDGKIVVTGLTATDEGTDLAVVRYRSDGSLDPGFGGDGIVTNRIGNAPRSADAIGIQEDGKIVAAGITADETPVVRYRTAQGDVRTGRNPSVSVGDDRYNTTGAGQSLSTSIRSGQTRVLRLGVQNENSVIDRFQLRGTPSNNRFEVRYLLGRRNLTGRLRTGRYLSDSIGGGGLLVLKVEVKSKSNRPGSRRTLHLDATSQFDPLARDRASIRLRNR